MKMNQLIQLLVLISQHFAETLDLNDGAPLYWNETDRLFLCLKPCGNWHVATRKIWLFHQDRPAQRCT